MGNGVTGDVAVQTNDSANIDERGLLPRSASQLESPYQLFNIVAAIFHIDNIPSTSTHFSIDVLGICEVNRSIASNLVVVVDDSEIVQTEVTSKRNSLKSNAFL